MTPGDDSAETEQTKAADQALFRRTVVRVMTVQVLALIALWLLQARFSP